MARKKDAPIHVVEVGKDSLKVDGQEQMGKRDTWQFEGFKDITEDGSISLGYLVSCSDCGLETYLFTLQAAKYIADIHGFENRMHNPRVWESQQNS